MRSLIFAAALALPFLFTGCQTPHEFASPDGTWTSHIGQLKHTNRQRTLIGEVVVQQLGADEFQLDFLKGGSFPLISVRQDAQTARAEGLLARGRWQGTAASAQVALKPWLALREAFAHPRANPPGAITKWTGKAKTSDGSLEALSLNFPNEQQRFDFQFNR